MSPDDRERGRRRRARHPRPGGGETVAAQPGGLYGGWLTSDVVGPVKGEPGVPRVFRPLAHLLATSFAWAPSSCEGRALAGLELQDRARGARSLHRKRRCRGEARVRSTRSRSCASASNGTLCGASAEPSARARRECPRRRRRPTPELSPHPAPRFVLEAQHPIWEIDGGWIRLLEGPGKERDGEGHPREATHLANTLRASVYQRDDVLQVLYAGCVRAPRRPLAGGCRTRRRTGAGRGASSPRGTACGSRRSPRTPP